MFWVLRVISVPASTLRRLGVPECQEPWRITGQIVVVRHGARARRPPRWPSRTLPDPPSTRGGSPPLPRILPPPSGPAGQACRRAGPGIQVFAREALRLSEEFLKSSGALLRAFEAGPTAKHGGQPQTQLDHKRKGQTG
jgi:hypothetical protein